MICVSLAEKSVSDCLAVLRRVPFAEIRLDLMKTTPKEVHHLFSHHPNLIATCRPGTKSDRERKELLMQAVASGAAFVDVELEAEAGYRDEIVRRARSHGCRPIVSFHDHGKTPARGDLKRIVQACFHADAEIAKVACMVRTARDNARLLGLLDDARKVVVVGMGEMGSVTRVVAPLLGSPFTFASLSPGKETAEGQLDMDGLHRVITLLGASIAVSGKGTNREEGGRKVRHE